MRKSIQECSLSDLRRIETLANEHPKVKQYVATNLSRYDFICLADIKAVEDLVETLNFESSKKRINEMYEQEQLKKAN
jgi:hypothetical protein